MCNFIHQKSATPIPPEGEGWKMFTRRPDGQLTTWMFEASYEKASDTTVQWSLAYLGDGFCIFLKEEELRDAFGGIPKRTAVRKVTYKGGISKHKDPGMTYKEIAICKEFTVELEEGEFL